MWGMNKHEIDSSVLPLREEYLTLISLYRCQTIKMLGNLYSEKYEKAMESEFVGGGTVF